MMRPAILILATALLGVAPALADERLPPVADETALKECGACHMAYQPQLLPAESWRRLFDGLSDHFGEDASLSEPVRQKLLEYYLANAGRERGAAPPLRITELDWWVREHRRVEEKTWTSAEVRFKGNCVACHKRAERGYYEDD